MDNNLIELTEKWIDDIYFNSDHLLRTGHWIKQLYPKADDALIIAATTHDVERAFPKGRKPPSPELKGARWDDLVYNRWHGKRSAKFVSNFLKKNGASKDLIDKVVRLIIYHEKGGWKEADYLRDADSISFLEINVPFFISRISKDLSKKEVGEKFDYMFRRISSKKAKELATPFYSKAITDLDKIED